MALSDRMYTSNNPVKYIDPSGHMPVNDGRVICNDAGQCYPAVVHSGGNFSPPSNTKQPEIKKGRTSELENAIIHIPSGLFNLPNQCQGSNVVCPLPEVDISWDFSRINIAVIIDEFLDTAFGALGPIMDWAIEIEGEEPNTLYDPAIDTAIDNRVKGYPISGSLSILGELWNARVVEEYCPRKYLPPGYVHSRQEDNPTLSVSYSEYLHLVQGGYLKEHSILNLRIEYP